MPSYLITGASRGLGLAFATQLLKNESNVVIATARNPQASASLQGLKSTARDGSLHIVQMDVDDQDSILRAAETVSELLPKGLDTLINNAGVAGDPEVSFEEADLDEMMEQIRFTVTTPIKVLRGFLPLLRKGETKTIVFITSLLGSLELAPGLPGLTPPYCVARASLNMLVRKWSTPLKQDGITAVLMHPGWIRETELGSGIEGWMDRNGASDHAVPLERSAENCMKLVQGFTAEDHGMFYNHDGTKLPW